MRLVSFTLTGPLGPVHRLGVLTGTDALIDITAATRDRLVAEGVAEEAAERIADAITPPRVVDFIAAGHLALDAAASTLEWAGETSRRYQLADVHTTGRGFRLGYGPERLRRRTRGGVTPRGYGDVDRRRVGNAA
jgi:hypothetical protein